MRDPNCIFCKIVAGEIPAEKVYEDETAIAFLDIKPVNLGHTLVVPKAHYETFLKTPPETLKGLIPTVQKIAAAVKKGTNADGVNVSTNNDPAAGQLVFHTHFHIIPRFKDDGLVHWGHHEYKEEEFKITAEKIKKLVEKTPV